MKNELKPIICHSTDGRSYKIGAKENTEVIFKADGDEVANQYSITEWWMEAGGPGPAPHIHEENNELIYVLQGPVSVLVNETWQKLETGGLVIIPAKINHTFRNDSDQRVGILNIFLSGAYEAMMPHIIKAFANK